MKQTDRKKKFEVLLGMHNFFTSTNTKIDLGGNI